MTKNVLIVGTGTIGEPLIGLLALLRKKLKIGEVYFHKRTPLLDEIAKVKSLCDKGAKLVVTNGEDYERFLDIGNTPICTLNEALNKVSVVIDCTPAGNKNKDELYLGMEAAASGRVLFIAQGSEKGFGIPYAYGINDQVLDDAVNPRFIQVVSCNTHNIAALIKTVDKCNGLISGDFVCLRRANDISQDGSFVASPTVSKHTDTSFGTHHARDVYDLLSTTGDRYNIFSSAMKTNTQYMHTIRFNMRVRGHLSLDDLIKAFEKNKHIALTHKTSANKIFSFGRDHGYYGRIYNQTVIPVSSLFVRNDAGETLVSGFCYTPQDGNSLLSSAIACVYGIHGDDYKEHAKIFDDFLFGWI